MYIYIYMYIHVYIYIYSMNSVIISIITIIMIRQLGSDGRDDMAGTVSPSEDLFLCRCLVWYH